MTFLAQRYRPVVVTPRVGPVAEVPAVFDDSVPPVEITPAIPGTPEVPAVMGVETAGEPYIESDAATVARNLAGGAGHIDYFDLDINSNRQSALAQKVRLKVGPRTAAPAREIAVAELQDGTEIGSVEVDA
jgi:hypothetical protein